MLITCYNNYIELSECEIQMYGGFIVFIICLFINPALSILILLIGLAYSVFVKKK